MKIENDNLKEFSKANTTLITLLKYWGNYVVFLGSLESSLDSNQYLSLI